MSNCCAQTHTPYAPITASTSDNCELIPTYRQLDACNSCNSVYRQGQAVTYCVSGVRFVAIATRDTTDTPWEGANMNPPSWTVKTMSGWLNMFYSMLSPNGDGSTPGAATTEQLGTVELATDAEGIQGTDNLRVITPAVLAAVLRQALNNLNVSVSSATVTTAGITRFATSSEAAQATANNVAVTPAGLQFFMQSYLAAHPISVNVASASMTQEGTVRLATANESTAGTSSTTAATPAGVKAAIDQALATMPADVDPDATTTQKGMVELADNAETVAGTSTTLATTPAGVKAAINNALSGLTPSSVADATTAVKGIVRLATPAEALAGTPTNVAVTPDGLLAALAAQHPPILSDTAPANPALGQLWLTNSATAAPYAKNSSYYWNGSEWQFVGGQAGMTLQIQSPAYNSSGIHWFPFSTASITDSSLNATVVAGSPNMITLPKAGTYLISAFYLAEEKWTGAVATDYVGGRLIFISSDSAGNNYDWAMNGTIQPAAVANFTRNFQANVAHTVQVPDNSGVKIALETTSGKMASGTWRVNIKQVG